MPSVSGRTVFHSPGATSISQSSLRTVGPAIVWWTSVSRHRPKGWDASAVKPPSRARERVASWASTRLTASRSLSSALWSRRTGAGTPFSGLPSFSKVSSALPVTVMVAV